MLSEELATASNILATEGVLDVFGHVSMRDPANAGQFLLPRARSPELIEPSDILTFGLDSEPIGAPGTLLFSERVIHGCMYARRPDVNAICHLHGAAIMPFCITGVDILPVTHVGAVIGQQVPFWSMQAEFGDTNMLVSTVPQGDSLARAMGEHWVVLMRNHGAVVAARSVRELVYRCVYLCLNVELQRQSMAVGNVTRLTDGEIDLAGWISEGVLQRAWEYWTARLAARRAAAAPKSPEQ